VVVEQMRLVLAVRVVVVTVALHLETVRQGH
jgi:hypothetical protein